MNSAREVLVQVSHLSVAFPSATGSIPVVDDVSFEIRRGAILGLVGESGSGKSVTSLAVMGLVGAKGGKVQSGSVELDGQELLRLSQREWASVRGDRIGMIFQQPTRCLNPAFTVGAQIAETLRRHEKVSRKAAWSRAISMLDRVGIPNASERARAFPHQWSGGMCQRAMIAQALICEPDLLIADEPTTALDPTVQARILDLLRDIQRETGIAILLITHDLGVIADMADDIAVMYAGQIVEKGRAEVVLTKPLNPYTQALIQAVPAEGVTELRAIPGTAPQPDGRPLGCRFAPRCEFAQSQCREPGAELVVKMPQLGHLTRCVRADELQLGSVS